MTGTAPVVVITGPAPGSEGGRHPRVHQAGAPLGLLARGRGGQDAAHAHAERLGAPPVTGVGAA